MSNKVINLFGGINSLGVPYTRDNVLHVGFFDLVGKDLLKKGYNVDSINMFRLNKNHTWDFEKVFTDNVTLSKLYQMQVNSITDMRAVNKLLKYVIPENMSDHFTTPANRPNQTLSDIYTNSENPVFIYSCGPNDFFSFIGGGPVEILNPEMRERMPKNYPELIAQTVKNVRGNLSLLNQLNTKVKIMVLGMFDSPLYRKIEILIYLQRRIDKEDIKFERKINKLIELYNSTMAHMCHEFNNVEFIDISHIKHFCAPVDFHPSIIGNLLIAHSVNDKLEKHLTLEEITK